MNSLSSIALYSKDEKLTRTIHAYLHTIVDVQFAGDIDELETVLNRTGPLILLLDLVADGALDVLGRVSKESSENLVVALASLRSDPALKAEAMGAYSVISPDTDRHTLQSLIVRTMDYQRVLQENRMLRESTDEADAVFRKDKRDSESAVPAPSLHFAGAFRHFDNVEAVFESVVEDVANIAHVSRVGVFSLDSDNRVYRFQAGVRCMPDTRRLTVDCSDQLVKWLTVHAHTICRGKLGHMSDPGEKLMLQRALDAHGAEVIIPLQGRERTIGWLFVGHHVTGVPFQQEDLENLVGLAEHVSLMLDNALLYGEVAVQKTLAETVLHSIPIGIVAAGADGRVRWFNEAAARMLSTPVESVMNQPVARLGSRLAHLLARGVDGQSLENPRTWTDKLSGRTLSAMTRPLMNGGTYLGAVAIVHDLTKELLLREKQERIDRATFWAELAAAMSHEVRNPLVAISTFAQLLPERYEDEEFREKFSVLVSQEIARLNGMIDQINAFANPPDLAFVSLRIDQLMKRALALAKKRVPGNGVAVKESFDKSLPILSGDETALTDCLAHLIVNAIESVAQVENPMVKLSAREHGGAKGEDHVEIRITDNGVGIPTELRDKVFSPFCTTKARGIGLGLPIVRRTITDHSGNISIETGSRGTIVVISLPALIMEKEYDEARACS
ncbi:MAG: ATP-binding protein [Kiritimatiellia bacterium]|jgi:nitrogen-specific signal transduction histidine kinase|nr:ATP-binding protein [Kiritimatiellia bacterium]